MLDVWELEDFQVLKDLKDLKELLELLEFKELKDPQVFEELKEIMGRLDLQEKHTLVSKLTQLNVTQHFHHQVPSQHLHPGQLPLES